ncbi:immunoglobulin-like domain-containing protein (plasmid) [Clostridium perfringens]
MKKILNINILILLIFNIFSTNITLASTHYNNEINAKIKDAKTVRNVLNIKVGNEKTSNIFHVNLAKTPNNQKILDIKRWLISLDLKNKFKGGVGFALKDNYGNDTFKINTASNSPIKISMVGGIIEILEGPLNIYSKVNNKTFNIGNFKELDSNGVYDNSNETPIYETGYSLELSPDADGSYNNFSKKTQIKNHLIKYKEADAPTETYQKRNFRILADNTFRAEKVGTKIISTLDVPGLGEMDVYSNSMVTLDDSFIEKIANEYIVNIKIIRNGTEIFNKNSINKKNYYNAFKDIQGIKFQNEDILIINSQSEGIWKYRFLNNNFEFIGPNIATEVPLIDTSRRAGSSIFQTLNRLSLNLIDVDGPDKLIKTKYSATSGFQYQDWSRIGVKLWDKDTGNKTIEWYGLNASAKNPLEMRNSSDNKYWTYNFEFKINTGDVLELPANSGKNPGDWFWLQNQEYPLTYIQNGANTSSNKQKYLRLLADNTFRAENDWNSAFTSNLLLNNRVNLGVTISVCNNNMIVLNEDFLKKSGGNLVKTIKVVRNNNIIFNKDTIKGVTYYQAFKDIQGIEFKDNDKLIITDGSKTDTYFYNMINKKFILEKDKQKPVIKVEGVADPANTPIEINVGESHDFSTGVTAIDDIDGTLNVSIDVSNIDFYTPGKYTVTYIAIDYAGNETTLTRPVIVKAKENTKTDIFNVYFDENNSSLYINASFEGIDNEATEEFTKVAKLVDSQGQEVEGAVITTQNFKNDPTHRKFQLRLTKEVQDKLSNGTYNIEVSAEINGKQHKALLSSTKEYNVGRDTIYVKCPQNGLLTIEKAEAQKAEANINITGAYFNSKSNNFVLDGTFEGADIVAEKQFAKTATIVDENGTPVEGIEPIRAGNIADNGKYAKFQLIVSRDTLNKLANGTYKIKMSGVVNSITCEGFAKTSEELNVINTTACDGKILKSLGAQNGEITLVKDDLSVKEANIDITNAYFNSKSNNFVLDGTFEGVDTTASKQFTKIATIVDADGTPVEGVDTIKARNISDPGKFAKFQLIVSTDIMNKLKDGTYKIKMSGTIDSIPFEGFVKTKKTINIHNTNAVTGKDMKVSTLKDGTIQLTKENVKETVGISDVTVVQSNKNGYVIKGTFGAEDTVATAQFIKTAIIVDEQGNPVESIDPIKANNVKDETFKSFQLLVPTDVLNKLQDGTYKIKISGTIDGYNVETILKSTNGIKGVNKEIDNKTFVVQAKQNQELNLIKNSK